MNTTRIVLSVLLALLLLTTGGGKLAGLASSHAIRDSLHVPAVRWRAIGVGELGLVAALVAGLWLPVVGLLAALGVVVLMVGAVLTRRAAGGPAQAGPIAADVVLLAVAAVCAVLAVTAG